MTDDRPRLRGRVRFAMLVAGVLAVAGVAFALIPSGSTQGRVAAGVFGLYAIGLILLGAFCDRIPIGRLRGSRLPWTNAPLVAGGSVCVASGLLAVTGHYGWAVAALPVALVALAAGCRASSRGEAAVAGTTGYAEQAQQLIGAYESVSFDRKYRTDSTMLPAPPSSVLDVGAGTGADAAWLAQRGYRVVAVEPTAALRDAGRSLHPLPGIEWIDDHLPALERVLARGERYDLILVTAVWMHLDAAERRRAMRTLRALLADHGRLGMAIRQGPPPAGRRMFAVPLEETPALARSVDLRLLRDEMVDSTQPANRAAGIRWQRLVFDCPPR